LACSMNKLELVDQLSEQTGISKPHARHIVGLFFDSMAAELAAGKRVEIRGLCSFYVKNYKSYTGRNPKTGEQVSIKSKKLPFFKCGKELKDRVDKRG
jgi:integration host factor subunit beta